MSQFVNHRILRALLATLVAAQRSRRQGRSLTESKTRTAARAARLASTVLARDGRAGASRLSAWLNPLPTLQG